VGREHESEREEIDDDERRILGRWSLRNTKKATFKNNKTKGRDKATDASSYSARSVPQ
jgi:hypothetical protein